jgi:hypothetical protein
LDRIIVIVFTIFILKKKEKKKEKKKRKKRRPTVQEHWTRNRGKSEREIDSYIKIETTKIREKNGKGKGSDGRGQKMGR